MEAGILSPLPGRRRGRAAAALWLFIATAACIIDQGTVLRPPLKTYQHGNGAVHSTRLRHFMPSRPKTGALARFRLRPRCSVPIPSSHGETPANPRKPNPSELPGAPDRGKISRESQETDGALELFGVIDTDGDGLISPEELQQGLCGLSDEDVCSLEVQELIDSVDENSDGSLNLSEFRTITSRTRNEFLPVRPPGKPREIADESTPGGDDENPETPPRQDGSSNLKSGKKMLPADTEALGTAFSYARGLVYPETDYLSLKDRDRVRQCIEGILAETALSNPTKKDLNDKVRALARTLSVVRLLVHMKSPADVIISSALAMSHQQKTSEDTPVNSLAPPSMMTGAPNLSKTQRASLTLSNSLVKRKSPSFGGTPSEGSTFAEKDSEQGGVPPVDILTLLGKYLEFASSNRNEVLLLLAQRLFEMRKTVESLKTETENLRTSSKPIESRYLPRSEDSAEHPEPTVATATEPTPPGEVRRVSGELTDIESSGPPVLADGGHDWGSDLDELLPVVAGASPEETALHLERALTALEVLHLWAPLAHAVGLKPLVGELESLSFQVLFPHNYGLMKSWHVDKHPLYRRALSCAIDSVKQSLRSAQETAQACVDVVDVTTDGEAGVPVPSGERDNQPFESNFAAVASKCEFEVSGRIKQVTSAFKKLFRTYTDTLLKSTDVVIPESQDVEETIEGYLNSDSDIERAPESELKHIWSKPNPADLPANMHDLIAIRVILHPPPLSDISESLGECLGIPGGINLEDAPDLLDILERELCEWAYEHIASLWPEVPGRFKNYIRVAPLGTYPKNIQDCILRTPFQHSSRMITQKIVRTQT
uniref:EF-hand domain-containing protein n=1 Tax=Lotharella globosa TaxID=91324 RepID=A0A7S3YII1_9EUKA